MSKQPTENQMAEAAKVRADYTHTSDGRITQPGKFEGEPIFAPYYWDIALQGFADSDHGTWYGFRFTNDGEDFALWPELKKWLGRKRSFQIFERDDGFVMCR